MQLDHKATAGIYTQLPATSRSVPTLEGIGVYISLMQVVGRLLSRGEQEHTPMTHRRFGKIIRTEYMKPYACFVLPSSPAYLHPFSMCLEPHCNV